MAAPKPPARITIDKAFQLLLQKDEPHAACEQLNTALRTGRIKLWADGAETSPSFFASHLLVTAAAAPAGGWSAKMTALRALARADYEWTVSGVDGLLESKPGPQRRRPGPVTKYDWHTIDGEIARRCINPKSGRVAVPKNERKLAADVLEWFRDKYDAEPAESAMCEAVRRVCAMLRQV